MRNFLLIAVAIVTLTSCKQEKTAFVNNTRVVSDFKEMKEAEAKWTKKNDELRAELQQKAMVFQKEVQDYEANKASLSKKKLQELTMELQTKQQSLQREQQTRVQEIQQKSGAEIDTIVKNVKEFIKDYGKKNGYTYIYGDTETSNILYGKEELDITDKVLEALNKKDSGTVVSEGDNTINTEANEKEAVVEE